MDVQCLLEWRGWPGVVSLVMLYHFGVTDTAVVACTALVYV
jgi:hypothetical protein